MDEQRPIVSPHVLIFPFPVQGHLNSMLKLAELFSLSDFHVTFLNSDHNHRRLLLHTAIETRFARYPNFRFHTIPDGLPEDHPRSGERAFDIIASINDTAGAHLRKLLVSSRRGEISSSDPNAPPPKPITCVVADGVMGFAIDVAKEVGVPLIYFRTISACSFWAYFCTPRLLRAGEIPFKGNDKDELIRSIPGMEGLIRRRDLPSFVQGDPSDPNFHLVTAETQRTPEAHALIFNTFHQLEAPVLAQIRTHCPSLYTIGPLHTHLKSRLNETTSSSSSPSLSNSLWEEDRSCMTWLDSQPSDSVIYVSFGSITVMTRDEVMEFWHGLVNSEKRFLWVVRPGSMPTLGAGAGDGGNNINIPAEVEEGTRERGYIVGWAPQEEVLAHRSVGGFLTHGGWNSTLESMAAGKPMICWAYFADQQTNSRYVSVVWRVGVDMKDRCDRATVERLVRDVMEAGKRDELAKSTAEMAEVIRRSVDEGGSSYCDLNCLIEDIRLMSVRGLD